MSYDPHRAHDPEKGSTATRVLGAANMIAGAVGVAGGLASRNPLAAAVGGLHYYAGARAYEAGKARSTQAERLRKQQASTKK